MQLKSFLPLALATLTSAQIMTLAQVLTAQNATLSTLNQLLAAQPKLLATLTAAKDITIFAPSNTAFNTFLATSDGKAAAAVPSMVASLLQYHVLTGTFPAAMITNTSQFIPTMLTGTSNSTLTSVTGGQVVDVSLVGTKVVILSGLKEKSTVQTADLTFTGGVLHIVDTVLTVPPSVSVSALDSDLTAFVGAVTTSNLVKTVNALKDVTIFAPSNAAFQAIGSATGNLSTKALSSILQYHVINGTVGYSSLLTTGLANESFPTVQGGRIMITVEAGKVFVNSAQVTITDIVVSNGVMHVIDNVLNPANETVLPVATATTQAVAFAGATSVATVPFTSGIVPTTTAPSASKSTAGISNAGRGGPNGAVGAAALFGGAALVMAF